MEAARIADARATVASGWAAGIAAGAGAGLVLAALTAATASGLRRQPRSRRSRPQAILLLILILTAVLLLVAAALTSTPPRQYGPHPVPYVITSGIEVAEIAYVGILCAGLAVVIAAWRAAQARKRPPSPD